MTKLTPNEKQDLKVMGDLIIELEGQLALMTPNTLRKRLRHKLKEVDTNIEILMKSINDIHKLLKE